MVGGHLLAIALPFFLARDEILAHHFAPADPALAVLAEHPISPEANPDAFADVPAVRAPHQFRPWHLPLSFPQSARFHFLRRLGVEVDDSSGVPRHDPSTMETNVPGIFIAGVLAAGFDANRIFIENGKLHGQALVATIRS